MIDFLKNLQAALLKLLPSAASGLAFEGAGAVIVIIIAVVAGIVFKAMLDAVGKKFGEFIGNNARATTCLIFALAILAPLGAKRPYTAFAIVFLAVAAAIVHRRWGITPFASLLLVVVVGGVGLVIEGRVVDYQRRKADDQLTVYVVLPFQPSGAQDRDVLVNLSASLRNTIGEIFGTLANVKVQPEGSLQPHDLDDWRELTKVETRLSDLGLSPDIILQNKGKIIADPRPPAKYVITLLLSPRFHRNSSYGRDILTFGFDDQIEYLGIRASLELLAQMKNVNPNLLTKETETAILRNAAGLYLLQLKRESHCPSGPYCAPAVELADDPAITLAKALTITNAYPPDASSRVQEINDLRSRSLISKVDWLSPPQPARVPTPVTSPPVAQASQPTATPGAGS